MFLCDIAQFRSAIHKGRLIIRKFWTKHAMISFIAQSSIAQLAEQPAVNRQVLGSSPSRGAFSTATAWLHVLGCYCA